MKREARLLDRVGGSFLVPTGVRPDHRMINQVAVCVLLRMIGFLDMKVAMENKKVVEEMNGVDDDRPG